MDRLGPLVTFLKVVDSGSLSRAARSLGLSVPAVSRQISGLEAEVGAALLVRSTRRMNLTDAGRAWYAGGLRLLGDLDSLQRSAEKSAQARGRVVVSAPISLGLALIVPRLPMLTKKHPSLTVDLHLEDRLVDFVSEGVDVAIRAGVAPPDSTAYIARPVTQFRRQAYASPAYLKDHGMPRTVEQLAGHSCLVQLAATGPLTRWRLEKAGTVHEVDVTGPVRAAAPLALRDLASAGVGIALLPKWLVSDAVGSGQLRAVLPGWSTGSISAWAVFRAERRASPALRTFVDWFSPPRRG